MKKKYDIIVVGSGAAGLTVAIGGANIGADILLVEQENKLGGDCTHYGCVPSKTLISESKKSKDIKQILNYVRERVEYVENKSESPEKIKSFGIDLEYGSATIKDKNTIIINNKEFIGKNIVIAAGSGPLIPPIKGLENVGYLTNRSIFDVVDMKSITIIGAGPIGCELAQAFNRIGIKVTLLQKGNQILGREEQSAAQIVEEEFTKEGIVLHKEVDIKEVTQNNNKKVTIITHKDGSEEKIESDELLISTGRAPNTKGLGLEKVGVEFDKRGICIDSRCRTNVKNIYAIGDIARGPQFTHFANHQGRVVLGNILFKAPLKYSTKVLPRVTYTTPEVASIGVYEGDYVLEKEYSDIDRAITDGNTIGFIKLFITKKGYINGAVIVGTSAGEMIHEVAIIMKQGLKVTTISDTIHAYPTYSLGLRECVDQFRSKTFTKGKQKLLQRIMGFGKHKRSQENK